VKVKSANVISPILGITIGGLLWLLITSVVVHSVTLGVVIGILGIFTTVFAIKLANTYPRKFRLILGLTMLWVIILNFILANVIYDQIPSFIWGVPSGKDKFSILHLNIFLGLLSVFGFWLILKDIFSKK